jgi:hypothetical protein
MDYREDYPNIREEIETLEKRYHSKNKRIIRRMIGGYLLGMALILPHSLNEGYDHANHPVVRSRTNLTLACCGAVVAAGSLLTGLFLSIKVERNEGKRLEELETEEKRIRSLDEL